MKKNIFIGCSILIIIGVIVIIVILLKDQKSDRYPTLFNSEYTLLPDMNVDTILNSDQIHCTYSNQSGYDITIGEEYTLECQKNGKWYEVVSNDGMRSTQAKWNAMAYVIKAGSTYECNIDLSRFGNLEKGNYRLIRVVISMERKNESKKKVLAGKKYIIISEWQV